MVGLAALLLLLVVPVLAAGGVLERNRHAWLARYRQEEQRAVAGAGAFRSAEVSASRWAVVGGPLPLPVFFAAFSGYFAGQMWVPSAPLALLGLLTAFDSHTDSWWTLVLALSWIPGSISAIYTFRTASALLRGEAKSAISMSARNLLISVMHNAVLLSFGAVAWNQHARADVSVGTVAIYATAVLLQAAFMAIIVRVYRSRFVADDPTALLSLPEGKPQEFALDAELSQEAAPISKR